MGVVRQWQNDAAARMEEASDAAEGPAATEYPVRGMNGTGSVSSGAGRLPGGAKATRQPSRPGRGQRKGSVAELVALLGAPELRSSVDLEQVVATE